MTEEINTDVNSTSQNSPSSMWDEYDRYMGLSPEDPTRPALEHEWHRKYSDTDKSQFDQQVAEVESNELHPIHRISRNINGMLKHGKTISALPVLGVADFGMDAVGLLAPKLDDAWDEATKLDVPIYQGIRDLLSVVIPSVYTGGKSAALVQAGKMAKWKKLLAGSGLALGADSIILGLSDTSEGDTVSKILVDTFPNTWGPEGWIPVPSFFRNLDTDSPSVTKARHIAEQAFTMVGGSIVGAAVQLKSGKPIMSWFKPLDEAANKYKVKEISNNVDPAKLERIEEITRALNSGKFNKSQEKIFIDEIENLRLEIGEIDDVQSMVVRDAKTLEIERREAATRKILTNEVSSNQLDPDITPGLVNPNRADSNVPQPGNVARNMADTTAIKNSTSSGVPAPILTRSMLTKGLQIGPESRAAVMGVAEETRMLGNFDAIVDGVRFSKKQMNAAAWGIYNDIINFNSIEDLKNLFAKDRDIKNLLGGKLKISYINEEQSRGAAHALKYLSARYIGEDVTVASARVMDTLGREIQVLAEAAVKADPLVDVSKNMDLNLAKMNLLLDEYALNKYLSGWATKNKDWFKTVAPDDLEESINTLLEVFSKQEASIAAKNAKFISELKRLKQENPALLSPFMEVFSLTDGDVNSQIKLMTWAAQEVSPTGLLRSPDPKSLNLFTRNAWNLRYNNMLSSPKSAGGAGIGNLSGVILNPIEDLISLGWTLNDEGVDAFKHFAYFNGALFETNRRAIDDAIKMFKNVRTDPNKYLSAQRRDFIMAADTKQAIIDQIRPEWERTGAWGKIIQSNISSLLHDLGHHPAIRFGKDLMAPVDTFANVHKAHYISRWRAYQEVFEEKGFSDWTAMKLAESRYYSTMFDKNGLPKDAVLKAMAGEITLNLDDALASKITEASTAYPIIKEVIPFPRTNSNAMKLAASFTPLTRIPGFTKYAKAIYAKTEDDMRKVLIEYGLDWDKIPFPEAQFKSIQLRAKARQAFGTLLTASLWQYAMAGNINGPGHYNASRRFKERTELGIIPQTIKIGNNWVSYRGIPGVSTVLDILGTLQYYKNDITQPLLEDWHSKVSWCLAASFWNNSPLYAIDIVNAAMQGNINAWNKLVSNQKSWFPGSGAIKHLADAIDGTLKDIQGDIRHTLMNTIPGVSRFVPFYRDFWTNKIVNDINHPILKVWNASSPIKIHPGNEPWRKWLFDIKWDGLARLNKHSSGLYEYEPHQRQEIIKYMGELELWKIVDQMRLSGIYDEEVELLMNHRRSGSDAYDSGVALDHSKLRVIRDLDALVTAAQRWAEQRYISENPEIQDTMWLQQQANRALMEGDVKGAITAQQKQIELMKLLNLANPPQPTNQ